MPFQIKARASALLSMIRKPWSRPAPGDPPPVELTHRPIKYSKSLACGSPESHIDEVGMRYAVDFIGTPIGTDIFATEAGEIAKIVESFPDLDPKQKGQYEDNEKVNYMLIRDSKTGLIHLYAHIKQNSASELGLTEGDTIRAGQKIASVGHNGFSAAPHLHYALCKEEEIPGTVLNLRSVPIKLPK